MVGSKDATMGERRALLTDREREIIADEADVTDSYRYQTISRVRSRFGRLDGDLRALEEHGDLLEELRDVVCEDVQEPAGGPEEPPQDDPVAVLDEEGFVETDTAGEDVEAFLDDVEFPTSKNREECVAVVRAAYEHLKEHRTATKKEFVQEVMTEHPLGYDVEAALEKIESSKRYRGGWWRSVVAPGLEALPDVEKPSGGASEWEYTGEEV